MIKLAYVFYFLVFRASCSKTYPRVQFFAFSRKGKDCSLRERIVVFYIPSLDLFSQFFLFLLILFLLRLDESFPVWLFEFFSILSLSLQYNKPYQEC